MSYFAFVRSKLEYSSVVCNYFTFTDSNKFERKQRKFAAPYHHTLFQDVQYQYDNLLERLNLLTLHNRRRHFGAFFLHKYF
jgi:hypothetical protein